MKELTEYYHKIKGENIQQLPAKSAITGKTRSWFYREIKLLVKDTDDLLGDKKPWINKDLWEERKLELDILKLAIKNSDQQEGLLPDDSSLFFVCFFVAKWAQASWLPSIYNEFKDRLDEILETITPSQLEQNQIINLKRVEDKYKEFESGYQKFLIPNAKLIYLQKLQENSELGKVEEKLATIPEKELLDNLVSSFKEYLQQQDKVALEEFIEKKLKAIKQDQQTMQYLVSNLLNEFAQVYHEVTKFNKNSNQPSSYFGSSQHIFLSPPPKENKSRESIEENTNKLEL